MAKKTKKIPAKAPDGSLKNGQYIINDYGHLVRITDAKLVIKPWQKVIGFDPNSGGGSRSATILKPHDRVSGSFPKVKVDKEWKWRGKLI